MRFSYVVVFLVIVSRLNLHAFLNLTLSLKSWLSSSGIQLKVLLLGIKGLKGQRTMQH